MINVTHEQKQCLEKYIDNLDVLLSNDNVQELLDVIDDVIVNNILGNNDEPDETGIMLQRIYDQIFNQN